MNMPVAYQIIITVGVLAGLAILALVLSRSERRTPRR